MTPSSKQIGVSNSWLRVGSGTFIMGCEAPMTHQSFNSGSYVPEVHMAVTLGISPAQNHPK